MKMFFLVALGVTTISMKGGTIQVVGSGGSWQTLGTNAYFNNPSGDSGNALQCFTLGNCGQSTMSEIQYWGNPDGSPDLNIQLAIDGTITAALLYEGAGPGGINTNDLSFGGTPVFTGPDSAGAIGIYTFSGTHGLKFYAGGNRLIFNSETFLNEGGANELTNQHFAIFRSQSKTGVLWVGIEDLTRSQTVPYSFESLPPSTYSGDYNDMFVKLEWAVPFTEVPENISLIFTAGGLLVLKLARKRILI